MTNASMNRGGVNSLQVSVTITKLKQQIANLQNQIAAQQAVYVKQQSAGHGGGGGQGQGGQGQGQGGVSGMGGSTNDYLRNQHDPISTLQGPFAEMSMNKVCNASITLRRNNSTNRFSCV